MSPEQFLQVADLFPDPALLLTRKGIILAANRGVHALGLSRKALRGRSLAELTSTAADAVRAFLRLCSHSRRPVVGALHLTGVDGRKIACRCHGSVARHDPDGRDSRILVRLVGVESPTEFAVLKHQIKEVTKAIHRRKHAAKRRYQSEWLRITLSCIGDGVVTTDASERITFINPVAEALTGWEAAEALGRPLDEVFRVVNDPARRAVESAAGESPEGSLASGLANYTILVAKGGQQTPIDDSRALLRDAKGKVNGVVLIFRDATDRKRAEDALRDSEQRFAGFMQHLPGLAWIKDLRGRYVYANDAAEKAFRHARAQLYGKTDDDVFSAATAGQFQENDRQALASGTGVQVVETLEHEDGVLHHSLVSKFPIPGPSGKAALIGGMAIDVTDHKRAEQVLEESEQRFRQLAENIEDVFWMSDPLKNGVLYVSPAYEQLWGRTRQSLYEQPRSFVDAIHPADREGVVATFDRQRRGEATDVVYRVVRPDGTERWVRDRSFPVKDRSGRVYRVAGIAADVTERKMFEEALRAADRRKDEFLAMLAHELRNPLAPIRSALQVLKLPGADAAVTGRARETMERQVEYMVRLVDDLLDVSRIMRGKIELRKEPVELATVAARAVETSQPAIDAEGHELTVSVPAEPLWVDGDLVRLAQVVGNLLNNAAKYMERGGKIRLTCEREAGAAVLRVRDAGIGIAPDMLPRIFDMFVQADRRTKNAQGGMGIGLTLVRSLVEMHGGVVEAYSDGLGRGSEFVIKLPLLDKTAEKGELVEQLGATGSGRLAPRRVLVVDDNVAAAETLAMVLRLEGHAVTVAHDGLAALEQAAADPPDMAFVDLGMPKMDGCEVARRFRADAALKNVVLVALTGWGQEEDRRRTREAGFDLHLVKPVEPDVLQRLFHGNTEGLPDARQETTGGRSPLFSGD